MAYRPSSPFRAGAGAGLPPPLSSSSSSSSLPLFPPLPGSAFLPITSKARTSSTTTAATSTTTTAGSCTNCRKGHKRCGTQRPCQTCIDTGKADTCADGMTAYQASRRPSAASARASDGIASSSYSSLFNSSSGTDRLPLSSSSFDMPNWPNTMTGPLPAAAGTYTRPPTPPLSFSGSSSTLSSMSISTSRTGSLSSLNSLDFAMPSTFPGSGAPSTTTTPVASSVHFVLGTDMKIGRVSDESLKVLGYHPHEMVTQAFSFYLQARDRPKLDNLVSSILCPPFQTGLACPIGPVVLQRLPISHVTSPIPGLPPTTTTLKFRHFNKAYISCSLEISIGSGCGGSFSQPERAVLVIRLTPCSSRSGRAATSAATATRSIGGLPLASAYSYGNTGYAPPTPMSLSSNQEGGPLGLPPFGNSFTASSTTVGPTARKADSFSLFPTSSTSTIGNSLPSLSGGSSSFGTASTRTRRRPSRSGAKEMGTGLMDFDYSLTSSSLSSTSSSLPGASSTSFTTSGIANSNASTSFSSYANSGRQNSSSGGGSASPNGAPFRRPRSPYSDGGNSSISSGSGSGDVSAGIGTSSNTVAGLARPASPSSTGYSPAMKRRASASSSSSDAGSMPFSAAAAAAGGPGPVLAGSSFGSSSTGMSMELDLPLLPPGSLSPLSTSRGSSSSTTLAGGTVIGRRRKTSSSASSRNTWPPFPASSASISLFGSPMLTSTPGMSIAPLSSGRGHARQSSLGGLGGGPGYGRTRRRGTAGADFTTTTKLPPLASWAPEPLTYYHSGAGANRDVAAMAYTSGSRRGSLF